MTYNVTIVETRSADVYMEAGSFEEALEKVKKAYYKDHNLYDLEIEDVNFY